MTDTDGRRSLDRESITSGHTEVPLNVYRTTDPPLFAGFHTAWIDGTDPKTGATFTLDVGLASPYLTLRVERPGFADVYEYVDITELVEQRVAAIVAEQDQDAADVAADNAACDAAADAERRAEQLRESPALYDPVYAAELDDERRREGDW